MQFTEIEIGVGKVMGLLEVLFNGEGALKMLLRPVVIFQTEERFAKVAEQGGPEARILSLLQHREAFPVVADGVGVFLQGIGNDAEVVGDGDHRFLFAESFLHREGVLEKTASQPEITGFPLKDAFGVEEIRFERRQVVQAAVGEADLEQGARLVVVFQKVVGEDGLQERFPDQFGGLLFPRLRKGVPRDLEALFVVPGVADVFGPFNLAAKVRLQGRDGR